MNSIITKILLMLLFIVLPGTVYSQQNNNSRPAGPVTASTNIHYTGAYCEVCHEKTPVRGGQTYLKYNGDYNELCKCHNYQPGTYTHPVDIEPSEKKKAKIPPDLPLVQGKVTCITCHNIFLQCGDNPEYKFSNKRFLRGNPSGKRTELCFKCHDDTQYKKLDPHIDQMDEKGNIIAAKCLYCHEEKPDELRASFGEVKLLGNIIVICQRCHAKSSNHPANANHLVMPPLNILAMMKKTEKQFEIILPLDYDGKISCPTCHNPHQRGVIPSERIGARGASEEAKQRLPGKICMACHEK